MYHRDVTLLRIGKTISWSHYTAPSVHFKKLVHKFGFTNIMRYISISLALLNIKPLTLFVDFGNNHIKITTICCRFIEDWHITQDIYLPFFKRNVVMSGVHSVYPSEWNAINNEGSGIRAFAKFPLFGVYAPQRYLAMSTGYRTVLGSAKSIFSPALKSFLLIKGATLSSRIFSYITFAWIVRMSLTNLNQTYDVFDTRKESAKGISALQSYLQVVSQQCVNGWGSVLGFRGYRLNKASNKINIYTESKAICLTELATRAITEIGSTNGFKSIVNYTGTKKFNWSSLTTVFKGATPIFSNRSHQKGIRLRTLKMDDINKLTTSLNEIKKRYGLTVNDLGIKSLLKPRVSKVLKSSASFDINKNITRLNATISKTGVTINEFNKLFQRFIDFLDYPRDEVIKYINEFISTKDKTTYWKLFDARHEKIALNKAIRTYSVVPIKLDITFFEESFKNTHNIFFLRYKKIFESEYFADVYRERQNEIQYFHLIIFSTFRFFTTRILADFIAEHFSLIKTGHTRFIKELTLFLNFVNLNEFNLSGYRISIAGKINNKLRARKLSIKKYLKPLKLKKYDSYITESIRQAYTVIGVFSLKVLLYRNIN